ncbi:MAG: polyprenyl synthetase family protein [Bifidobacterium tibiigranuli]|jgi:geranylgeranyl diphosphate synthase type I|uniref:polyprenyl synthetase family protein n=1 Tax=Bifidobacterium tibiigranuli TaxID=2172043 RepID=UPI0026F15D16|nr:polyprenyl synthetase family protein [Bifidobacterium tibiigranuli]MCI1672778.1 polyprenyl synthetase family protein [Bifidobacterium tibiigranuli]MCI1712217.1 polyprenyl synthetase family protein [Bifidobacterium tibiigranuli]MCI1833215.1 polyprenyl synthetase family protein [Bifidobacterium tibiigranuli]
MSTDHDLRTLESRIGELTEAWIAPQFTQSSQSDGYSGLMPAVRAQAAASNAGGKRLRALLALSAFDAAQAIQHGNLESPDSANVSAVSARDAMIDLAAAVEIYQTSALIHDDIIDDSDLRRGEPSAHKALEVASGDTRIGTGLAIMLGNALATLSAHVAQEALGMLHNQVEGLRVFLAMQRDVAYGQVLDLSAEEISLDDPARLAAASLEVFRWKTASYTAIAPLELGFLAAGLAPERSHRNAVRIGEPLGIAFQLADDLIDVQGSSRSSGKPVGGDIREGKHTVLLADALQCADPADHARLVAIYGAPCRTDAEVRETIALFERTGALAQSEQRIAEQRSLAFAAIDNAVDDIAESITDSVTGGTGVGNVSDNDGDNDSTSPYAKACAASILIEGCSRLLPQSQRTTRMRM